jgi:hypothetical protein
VQVLAQAVDPCKYIPGGCDKGAVPDMLTRGISSFAQGFVAFGGAATVFAVVIGGAQIILNFGDESKVDKGRHSIQWALGGFALVLASQTLVNFIYQSFLPYAGSETATISILAGIVEIILSVFNVTFVLMILFAGVRMVLARGKTDEFDKAKTMIVWAAIGALVINVAHAATRAIFLTGL